MLNQFFDFIVSFEFLKEIFLILLGIVVGLLGQYIANKKKILKTKKSIKNISKKYANGKIVSLASAYPYFQESNLSLMDSNEQFILGFSDGLELISCFNNKTLDILGEEMGIDGFSDLVKKHQKIVFEEMRAEKNGRKEFNNEKFGVRKMVFTKTNDRREDSIVRIQFYKTNYYTHKVMRSVYHELCSIGHPISKCNRIEEVIKYYPFLTSFGIDSLLTIQSEELSEMIVLLKRSKYMANMNEDQWHISMNEGLSITDVDAITGKVSFHKGVIRGYLEELGIREEDYQINNYFHSIFLGTENLELGITTQAYVSITSDDLIHCYHGSEDGAMETTGDIKLIPATKKDINRFLETDEIMTDICRYCLELYLSHVLSK